MMAGINAAINGNPQKAYGDIADTLHKSSAGLSTEGMWTSHTSGLPLLIISLAFLLARRAGMKVIRHVRVDSRMIILDDQAHQQMTLHFQLSL